MTCAVMLLNLVLQSAMGQAPTSAPQSPREVCDGIIATLTEEAREALKTRAIKRSSADFSKTFQGEPPLAEINRAIARKVDADPFIDAYVRWQLTSFPITLESVIGSKMGFVRLIRDMPAMARNPRANPQLMQRLAQTAAQGIRFPAQHEDVNNALNELAARFSESQAMNTPGREFRKWCRTQTSQHGEWTLLLDIEELDASMRAGWPIDDIKKQLEEDLQRFGRDPEFTDQQRQSIINMMKNYSGAKNTYIASASIRDDALSIEYGSIAVDDFEVRRWQKYLERQ